jgi:hypothetical protein
MTYQTITDKIDLKHSEFVEELKNLIYFTSDKKRRKAEYEVINFEVSKKNKTMRISATDDNIFYVVELCTEFFPSYAESYNYHDFRFALHKDKVRMLIKFLEVNKGELVYLDKNKKNNDVSIGAKKGDIIFLGYDLQIDEAGVNIGKKANELVNIYNKTELKPSSPLFRGNIFKRCLAVIRKGKFKVFTGKKKKQQEYSFIETEKKNRIIAIKN